VTERALTCHPAATFGAQLEIAAEVECVAGPRVRVSFRLRGDLGRVVIPARASSLRVDGLWERTCFEAFIAPQGRAHYLELNFSPSTEWAAYAFDGYRQGMRPLPLPRAPEIAMNEAEGEFRVTADVDFGAIEDAPWPWCVGLSAVIADRAGTRSYWALRHPAAKPDFHDAAGFVWRLEGPVG
jgi:hypothetical protein